MDLNLIVKPSDSRVGKQESEVAGSPKEGRAKKSSSSGGNSKKTQKAKRKARRGKESVKDRWETMFDRLVQFKNKHGHCLVPNRFKDDRSLGSWVSTQRRQFKILISGSSESTPMNPERASKLMSIGFKWQAKDPPEKSWETRFHELCQFKNKHGHCLVPAKESKLHSWVSTQRKERKLVDKGSSSWLTQERIKALDELGFDWNAQGDHEPIANAEETSAPPSSLIRLYSTHGNAFLTPSAATSIHREPFQGALARSHPQPSMLQVQPTSPRRIVEPAVSASIRDQYEDMALISGMMGNRADVAALYGATQAESRIARQHAVLLGDIARKRALRHQRELLLSSCVFPGMPSLGHPSAYSALNQGNLFSGAQDPAVFPQTSASEPNLSMLSSTSILDVLQQDLMAREHAGVRSSSGLGKHTEEYLDSYVEAAANWQNKRRRLG